MKLDWDPPPWVRWGFQPKVARLGGREILAEASGPGPDDPGKRPNHSVNSIGCVSEVVWEPFRSFSGVQDTVNMCQSDANAQITYQMRTIGAIRRI